VSGQPVLRRPASGYPPKYCRVCKAHLWTEAVKLERPPGGPQPWSTRWKPWPAWIDGKLYCPNEANHPTNRKEG
jgi:hypothetical protein